MKRVQYHTQAEWHELRRQNIGGSDIGSLFNAWRLSDGVICYRHMFQDAPKGAELVGCVSPYKTGVRLWHERRGNLIEEPFNNPRTEAGTHFEAGIAAWAKERTGWDIRKVTDYILHEDVKGMAASLDYEIIDHPKGHTAMDCKETAPWIFKQSWLDRGEQPEPPLHIILQLHHQMACAEMVHSVAAVYQSGVDLFIPEVERNETIISMVEEAVTAFWLHVEENEAPDITMDFSVASDLYQSADKQILLDMTGKDEFQKLVDAWDFARQQHRRWGEAKDAAYYQILAEIREASEITLPDGRVLEAPTANRRGYTKQIQPSTFRKLSLTTKK